MINEELGNALIGMSAYDAGAVDSGIRDELLRAECIKVLEDMKPRDYQLFVSRLVREAFLSEKALEQGYGMCDALGFIQWLDEIRSTMKVSYWMIPTMTTANWNY